MTSRVYDNVRGPDEVEIVSGHKEETNSQSSSARREGTEASDQDEQSAVELYEGGVNKRRYTSR